MSEILYFVTAQSDVSVPVQPVGDTCASGQFNSHAVAVFDIAGQCFTDFADFAAQDQLVVVVHKIKIGSGAETLVAEAVTGFVVVECFVSRTFVDCGFRKIVAIGFTVGDGERDESIMTAFLEIDTGFRVEEVPVFVDVDFLTGIVVTSFDRVMDATVLQVEVSVQVGVEPVVAFYVKVLIQFVPFVTVIFVVRRGECFCIFDPHDTAEMVAYIFIDS